MSRTSCTTSTHAKARDMSAPIASAARLSLSHCRPLLRPPPALGPHPPKADGTAPTTSTPSLSLALPSVREPPLSVPETPPVPALGSDFDA